MEEKIPACLRKFPRYRYFTQPKRHDCRYSPQGGAVSFVAGHNIRSGNLPSYKACNVRSHRSQDNLTSLHAGDEVECDVSTARDDASESGSQPRNGMYSYVYEEAPKTDSNQLRIDDVEDEEVASIDEKFESVKNDSSASNTRANGFSLDVRRSSRGSDAASDVSAEEVVEDLSQDDAVLPRSDSQRDFDELMARIERGEKASKQQDTANTRPSPFQRPGARLDDRCDVNMFRVSSPALSDAGSIPEEMEWW